MGLNFSRRSLSIAKVMSCLAKIISFSLGSSSATIREAPQQDLCERILIVPDPFRFFRISLIISAAFCVTSIMTLPQATLVISVTFFITDVL